MLNLGSKSLPSASGRGLTVASLAPRVVQKGRFWSSTRAAASHQAQQHAVDADEPVCCCSATITQHGVTLLSRRSLVLASASAMFLVPLLQAGQVRHEVETVDGCSGHLAAR